MSEAIKSSELITNPDGSIFHLHLFPEDLADDVILVGDPGRVETIAAFFDKIEVKHLNREFYTITGIYRKHRLSVISTGIGTDNIDIVINELDALANIDLKTKEIKPEKKSLRFIRIGTSGSLQGDVPIGSFVISELSLGMDGLLRYYKGHEDVCLPDMEEAFVRQCQWTPKAARPYAVASSEELVETLYTPGKSIKGITLTANGFYGPQGRVLRLPLEMEHMNERIAGFDYNGSKIINFEMESAAIAGLSSMLGHHAATICLIIANRVTGEALPEYQSNMSQLIRYTLEKLTL